MNKRDYEKRLQETMEEVKKDIYLIKNKFSIVDNVNTLFKKHPFTMTAVCLSIGIYFSKKRGLRNILKMSSLFSAEKILEHTIKKYLSDFTNKGALKEDK
jgi:hypothetical protein